MDHIPLTQPAPVTQTSDTLHELDTESPPSTTEADLRPLRVRGKMELLEKPAVLMNISATSDNGELTGDVYSMSLTAPESFSDGVWLIDRSEGQLPDNRGLSSQVAMQVAQQVGPLPIHTSLVCFAIFSQNYKIKIFVHGFR
ncbi:unnamed protein product [Protopolystoma xenopodis]|uniref:Uncharacterized protein n=1 Tax=Protopolystoma xenopodis TaxID=117903 RepID=A0A3S5AU69_9PLAT|nr:unnamed protein product [Protopolystoma xenopodis]